jgi:hypothetical protein
MSVSNAQGDVFDLAARCERLADHPYWHQCSAFALLGVLSCM